jgi:hypothetical protein
MIPLGELPVEKVVSSQHSVVSRKKAIGWRLQALGKEKRQDEERGTKRSFTF